MKIAEGTYKSANMKGVLTPYLVWCKLKDYNNQGTVGRDKESITQAANYLKISVPTLRSCLAKLRDLGIVRRHRYSYSLVSYDKCWEILGLDMSCYPNKNRKGKFKIWQLSIEDLKAKIELEEIAISVSRQAYKSRKSILSSPSKFSDTEINSLKECRFIDLPQLLDSLYIKNLTVLKGVEEYFGEISLIKFCEMTDRSCKFNKITPFLTCKNTAKILGYQPSPRTGQNIRARIQKAGLARFETRSANFLETKNWSDAVAVHKLEKSSYGRVKEKNGKATHRLISKMVLL
jgi:DNA-binding Lrp family transcriptional regulator